MAHVNELANVLTEIDDPQLMKRFIGELFTPAEIQDMALRWRLMNLLHEGTPQRTIAKRLGISLCKITRGSKVLKRRNSASKKILIQMKGVSHASREKTRKPARPQRVLR